MLRAPTPTAAVILPIVFDLSFVIQYLGDIFWRILKIILNFKPLVLFPTSALAPH